MPLFGFGYAHSCTEETGGKKYVIRNRSKEDERNLIVSITQEGESLKEQAVQIPMNLRACVNVKPQEAQQLYQLLYKLLDGLS